MTRAKLSTFLLVLLSLSACWGIGCSSAPSGGSDYEVVAAEKPAKNDSESSDTDEASATKAASSGASSDDAVVDRSPTSGATSDAGTGGEATKNAILLDGKPMTITDAEAHVNPYGAFYTVTFNGDGAAAKTQIILNFQAVETGCNSGVKANQLFLYPPGAAGNDYESTDGSACGLQITAYPTKVGDVASGSYKGTLDGLNGVSGKTKKLEMTFAIKSIPQP